MISVIIPVYNAEKYLDRTVNSILNQTYHDFELILVDDGSTDNSPKICDEYALKHDEIVVLHKKNAGLGEARHSGLDAATGDYIAFFDSDDYIDEIYVEKMYTN